jgi:transcription elongation factor Elf1
MAKLTDGIDNCPFCGGTQFSVYSRIEEGGITCACGASMKCKSEPGGYEPVGDNMYRRIPFRSGLSIAKERWNGRVKK